MTTATDGAGLREAIQAQPRAEDLRLIYADWCEENGREKLAAMIRAESPDDIHAAFRAWIGRGRLKDLVVGAQGLRCVGTGGRRRHDARGWPYLKLDSDDGRAGGTRLYFWRGLISVVHCPLAVWLQYGKALRAVHPIWLARPIDVYPVVARLAPGGFDVRLRLPPELSSLLSVEFEVRGDRITTVRAPMGDCSRLTFVSSVQLSRAVAWIQRAMAGYTITLDDLGDGVKNCLSWALLRWAEGRTL